MRYHTGEKPFKCNMCEKKFVNSSEIKVHQRSHTGLKPYKCKICEKEFTTLSKMKTHKHSHSGEKPFECDICQKPFSRKNLNIHKKFILGKGHLNVTHVIKKFWKKII